MLFKFISHLVLLMASAVERRIRIKENVELEKNVKMQVYSGIQNTLKVVEKLWTTSYDQSNVLLYY